MRYLVLAALVAAVAFGAGWVFAGASPAAESGGACAGEVEALFSPGADAVVMGLVESANESIDVEMYQFSYEPLMDELVAAEERGVRVRVILEPRLDGDDNLNAMERLLEGGVEAKWASLEFARTHSKTMVVDGREVLVGSPNWSYNAMLRNRESAVVVKSEEIAGEFGRIFENDWEKGSAG